MPKKVANGMVSERVKVREVKDKKQRMGSEEGRCLEKRIQGRKEISTEKWRGK